MEKRINFDAFSAVRSIAKDFVQLEDAYMMAHLDHESISAKIPTDLVLQADGMSVLFVRSGHLKMELNLDRFDMQGPSLCLIHPMSRVVLDNCSQNGADMHVLFMSQKFLQNLNINFSAFTLPAMETRPSPMLELTDEEYGVLAHYIELLTLNAANDTTSQLAWNLGSSLVSAIVYEMAKIQYKRINLHRDQAGYHHSSRLGYVQDFIKLVRAHYGSERTVAFYASKLYISPKYLSLIVKEATGRSAARWIDEFVLMEAKNLLRYSGKNIQQVAYTLNFTNQSAFGKYFKHLTGMSPTEYQKS
ncbi:MAG: AraC family transcriptional regulator [Muribaculaceae bacterium]|nr:AraC family transcriptional regulator [Muribaculaceae bacterium]